MESSYPSSGNNTGFFSFSVLLGSFIYKRICFQGNTLQKSLSKFWSFLLSPREIGNSKPWREPTVVQEVSSSNGRSEGHGDGGSGFLINREEVEMVMGRLGLHVHCSDGGIREAYGADEIWSVLGEKVSMGEVEGAFQVFDENGDGFIDAEDLQRVLCRLGFREGMEVEDCEKMIRAFDGNGDGKIDFQEFLILMEN